MTPTHIGLFRCFASACIALLTACSAPTGHIPVTMVPTVPDKITKANPVPANSTTFGLPSGNLLAARVWVSPQPQHIVLAVHGFNDYSKAFEPLAQHLVDAVQATVYAYDQRGFGANPEPGIWPGTHTLLSDLRNIAAQLRERHPGLPLTVLGESMGGAVVMVAASEVPGLTADQLILQAPAVWGAQSMPWYQRLSLQVMNAMAPEMTFTGRGLQSLGIRPTDDPEVSRDLSRDPLFIKATRVGSLAGVTELMGRAQTQTNLPPQRTLVLYGQRDRIIPQHPVCDWLTHLNTTTASTGVINVVIYPEGWHLLTRQLRNREPLQDMTHWLQNRPVPHQQTSTQAQQTLCVPG
ncbi:alpha/beta fold hydrolase [Limnohabitans sp. Rim8]|uniref:alpha/beta fold hydrolase n=1 Tax=Limnohabitans sp. Rim8 TaxID=1100718 RepID=UPI0026195E7E|nr:alpha/beta fold hydrolase [Limnohabitans sp. Rim8]